LGYDDTREYIYLWVWVKAERRREAGHEAHPLMPRGDFDRSARKAQTRARLLEAAARVYARAGFGGATLDEVAAEAGYTKGAVYSHFGSKENLLLALLEEHLAEEIAEQIQLFETTSSPDERPVVGAARYMERLDEDPDPFRLFVELWSYAQRDERLRRRVAGGMGAMRATFERFAAAGAAESGIDELEHASERFASVMLGLSIGMAMVRLIEPDTVPASLLGAAMSVLIEASMVDAGARAMLADPDRTLPAAHS
jgi:AcrR family transcriptional regulator